MTEPLSVCLIPLGCPKNLVDSEKMLADLAEAGCIVGAPADDADVIVINSCGFLAASRAETLEVIEEANAMRDHGKCRHIVVAGCLPNRDGEELLKLDGVDIIVGASDRTNIVEAVLGSVGRKSYLTASPQTFLDGAPGDAGRFRLTLPHTAYLRIAEGCSRTCAFCTIPQIRGPFRSKPMEMILDEARELIESGAKELSIIAQDTACWGRELPEPSNLATLLRELNALDGAVWIRVLYAYPNLFDRELREVFNECSKVVPYVDMPLQHISTSVLSRMRRNITRDEIVDTLNDLREHVNTMVIRTTFITGFPGETQAEFDELHQFIQEFPFDALGVFE
ncbi:MAG: MiaB/RimO family radical SAM methylthiotransferase, partial [Phycisphaerales bacterium]|nr:MiaB/RimO family radical SAM methylthiotransferase [Phycisphaerales bacterium]